MNEQNPITILLLETNCYEIHNCSFGSFCYSKKIQIDTIFQIEEKCGCRWISRVFFTYTEFVKNTNSIYFKIVKYKIHLKRTFKKI